MAYATLADLTARAGVLADAWPSDDVSYADLEVFLDQTASSLDGWIGGAGYITPVSDAAAIEMLRPVNADMALELAIEATWPADPPATAQLVIDRVNAYRVAMAAGEWNVLAYLGSTSAGTHAKGASDFWTNDANTQAAWDIYAPYLSSVPGLGGWLDPWGVATAAGPAFRRGMRL